MARMTGYKRRATGTVPMPAILSVQHVVSLSHWPLRERHARRGYMPGAVDVMLHVVPEIALGDKYNARRVRCDGATFYIEYRGRRVPLDFALTCETLDLCTTWY